MISDADRRQGIRVQVNDEFAFVDGIMTEYVQNLSRGGLFLRCDETLPIGTEVALRFTILLDDLETIEGKGVVTHHAVRPVRGLGIRFSELTPASRALVERVCPG
jgi:uncharacterized protein (TIGR02266 family)